uniref:Uncharacterized protein n=1 Tax=Micrurus spixii TaxID=129469 RepID=A0A2D4LBN0_9SAUR
MLTEATPVLPQIYPYSLISPGGQVHVKKINTKCNSSQQSIYQKRLNEEANILQNIHLRTLGVFCHKEENTNAFRRQGWKRSWKEFRSFLWFSTFRCCISIWHETIKLTFSGACDLANLAQLQISEAMFGITSDAGGESVRS